MAIEIYRVMWDGETWVVRRDGAGIIDRAHTKEIAVESGRRRAQSTTEGQLIVHRMDGSVEDDHTFTREPRNGPGSGQKVLVIDDDEWVRRSLCNILRAGGYQPLEAVDGRDGVDAFMRGRFALVITDLYMPGLDGIETIQRIRELDSSVPIIAISGAGTDEFSPLQDAGLIGANRTIPKPFGVEQVLSVVGELLVS